MSAATVMSGEAFRSRVSGHLAAALALVPDVVPDDVFDDRISPMMDELNRLDELLYGLGSDGRLMEDRERSRERRLSTKQSVPAAEYLVEQLDLRIQKVFELVGQPVVAGMVTSMFVDLLIDSFVRFLDVLPDATFADDRLVPQTFPSKRDPTVASIVALINDRKRAAAGAA